MRLWCRQLWSESYLGFRPATSWNAYKTVYVQHRRRSFLTPTSPHIRVRPNEQVQSQRRSQRRHEQHLSQAQLDPLLRRRPGPAHLQPPSHQDQRMLVKRPLSLLQRRVEVAILFRSQGRIALSMSSEKPKPSRTTTTSARSSGTDSSASSMLQFANGQRSVTP